MRLLLTWLFLTAVIATNSAYAVCDLDGFATCIADGVQPVIEQSYPACSIDEVVEDDVAFMAANRAVDVCCPRQGPNQSLARVLACYNTALRAAGSAFVPDDVTAPTKRKIKAFIRFAKQVGGCSSDL